MKHLKIQLARCAPWLLFHLFAAVETNHLQKQCRGLYTLLCSVFLSDQYGIYSYPNKNQYATRCIFQQTTVTANPWPTPLQHPRPSAVKCTQEHLLFPG